MTEVFHCTPLELRQQPYAAVQDVLMVRDVIARVKDFKKQQKTGVRQLNG